MEERTGVITFKGNPMTLVGREVRVGESMPGFTVLSADLTPVTDNDLRGAPVLINVVHSLDTGLCSLQTKRFNEELANLPETVSVVTISADLPFAQARYAQAEGIRHRILSDYRDFSFAGAFGVGIKELRLLARSIFVADAQGRIIYREIVPEVTHHPAYEPALKAVRTAAGS